MRTADAWLAYGTRQARDSPRMGVDPARTVIAPITALAPERPPTPESIRDRTDTRFLFVGRLIERKGLEVLLEPLRFSREASSGSPGTGRSTRPSPRRRLETPASVSSDTSPARASATSTARSDALVVPSLYEPWGLVVHEGLAHGLPVIATDQVGSADDLIDPGVNGYVVAAGSAEETAQAMRSIAKWTHEQRAGAVRRSTETLASCSFDRGADGFVQGCALALEHRKRTAQPMISAR